MKFSLIFVSPSSTVSNGKQMYIVFDRGRNRIYRDNAVIERGLFLHARARYREPTDKYLEGRNRTSKHLQARLVLSGKPTAELAGLGLGIVRSGNTLTGFQSVSQTNAARALLKV